ncbi:MAG: universal stress protein [Candidatus Bathyarchaeales archaeon]
MFKKILVPLDGSEHSLRALDVAIQIAKKFGAKITLIHVYSVTVRPAMMPEPTPMSTFGIPVMTPAEVSSIIEATRKAGSRILEEGEQRVKAENIEVETKLEEGHAVQEIVRVSKEGNYDLIVIGARGISKLREILLGSVSDAVIHHATCPVLVVK